MTGFRCLVLRKNERHAGPTLSYVPEELGCVRDLA